MTKFCWGCMQQCQHEKSQFSTAQARQLTLKLSWEPIPVTEKWRWNIFQHKARNDWHYAPLCAAFSSIKFLHPGDCSTLLCHWYRAKTDLTNVKYVHPAISRCTWSSSFCPFPPWTPTMPITNVWSHVVICDCPKLHHAFLRTNAVWGYLYALICLSYSAIEVKGYSLGVNKYIPAQYIGRRTWDFNCLRLNCMNNMSDTGLGSLLAHKVVSKSVLEVILVRHDWQ